MTPSRIRAAAIALAVTCGLLACAKDGSSSTAMALAEAVVLTPNGTVLEKNLDPPGGAHLVVALPKAGAAPAAKGPADFADITSQSRKEHPNFARSVARYSGTRDGRQCTIEVSPTEGGPIAVTTSVSPDSVAYIVYADCTTATQ